MTEKHREKIICLLRYLFLHLLCRDSCCCLAISKSGSRIQYKSLWQYKIKQADWSILCKFLAGTETTKLSQSPASHENEILCTVKARDEGWSQNVL